MEGAVIVQRGRRRESYIAYLDIEECEDGGEVDKGVYSRDDKEDVAGEGFVERVNRYGCE